MLLVFKNTLKFMFLCLSMYIVSSMSINSLTMAKDMHDLNFVAAYNRLHPAATNVFLPFLEQSSEDLDGTITFQYHYINELYPDSEAYKAFSTGTVDFATIRPGRFRDLMPLASIMDIPLMAPNAIIGSLLAQDIAKEFLEIRSELPADSQMLALWTSESYQLHSVEPIQNLADIKGKKVAVWNEFAGDLIKELGGTFLLINTADSFAVLDKGEADAVLAPLVALTALDVFDVAKYHLMLNAGVSSFVLSCHQPVWDQFTPEVQRYFKSVTGTHFSYKIAKSLEEWMDYDDIQSMKQKGQVFYELSVDDTEKLEEIRMLMQQKWLDSMPEEKKAIAREILEYTLDRAAYYKEEFASGFRK